MTTTNHETYDVLIIGGGAAGMMAAVSAAMVGASVCILEKNDRVGMKLGITGKGRCNVTNNCNLQEFMQEVPRNSKFLFAALSKWSTQDTMDFFENLGVPLKTERGRRVFPVSDRALDIVGAIRRACLDNGVVIKQGTVSKLLTDGNQIKGVQYGRGEMIEALSVIIATGGKSYPRTGSTGDGYQLAQSVGHSVTPLYPSLVPITCSGHTCLDLQGLSLKNVTLTIVDNTNHSEIYSELGEMLFTHFGLTGPLVLSSSAHLNEPKPGKYIASIDFKPALDEQTLDTRLLSDFQKYQNKDFCHALDDLLPQKLIPVIIQESGIPEHQKVNSITKEQRHVLLQLLKHFEIPITGFRPIEEAIVTRGGVEVKEIKPGTMQSKFVEGLYFAGEVMDVDAYTGGYNLQIAFSTGYLAGTNAAYFAFENK